MFRKVIVIALPLFFVALVLNLSLQVVSSNSSVSSVSPISPRSMPSLPGGLRNHFMLGLANQPGNIGWMTGSGAAWDARYQYLSGGANTGNGWSTWNTPPGQFVNYYVQNSDQSGYLSVFTYYMLLQSSPAIGSGEPAQDYNNLNNTGTMNAYYSDFKLLMNRLHLYNKPVIVHIEPDLWGFLEQRNPNPNAISASVASSGVSELAGYPDNVAGFARALQHLRDLYAPNVLLGYHISPWASSQGDLGTSHQSNFNVQQAAQETANFYLQTGANFDLMFYDIADRDAAYYTYIKPKDPSHWWDVTNSAFPNFNRFNQFALAVTNATNKRGFLWQVPIGNSLYRSVNNTIHHWQDNRVQYYLGGGNNQHAQDLANAGIVGILFGAGNSETTSYDDAAKDGITNPAPINGNTAVAQYSDDDGGYLRLQAQAFYARGGVSFQPAAPTGLYISNVSATSLSIAWSNPTADATGFSVERKTGTGGGWEAVATLGAGATTYTANGLQNGMYYDFRVRAYNPGGYSDYSNEASATTSLPAPSGLTLNTPRSTQVQLTWADNSNGEQNFIVQRSPDGTNWTTIATLPTNATAYLDSALSPDTPYFYQVQAVSAYTGSAFSNIASITTPPAEPFNLQAQASDSTSINLTWTSNSTTATGFQLDRRTVGGSWQMVSSTVPVSPTVFTDTNLITGTVYYYRLRAYVSNRQSANSNEASASTVGDLVVKNSSDDGNGNLADSLSKVLQTARSGPLKTITFASNVTTINFTHPLSNNVLPDGVTVAGGCGPSGPTINFSGPKLTLRLGKGATLYGLSLGGVIAPALSNRIGSGYLLCVKVAK